MARAHAMVASKRGTQRSPGTVRICQTSVTPTNVPTRGVHRPEMRSIPQAARNAWVIVVLIGGSRHKVKPARATNEVPTTKRMRSKPVPGQPPANVEYRRRNSAPFQTLLDCDSPARDRNPKKSNDGHSLEFGWQGGEQAKAGGDDYSSMIPLFMPIIAACVRSFAPNFERMDLTRLLTVSSVIES